MDNLQWFMLLPAIVVTGLLWAVFLRVSLLWRRRRLLNTPLQPDYIEILSKYVPLYRRIPADLKPQLHGLINVFLAEKRFTGCGGQEITDIVRLTTASQACLLLLLLNRRTRIYPKLKTIYVYPDAYVAKCIESDGFLVVEGRSVRLGESWENGPVVLAWNSIEHSARGAHDGYNVVLHEFAHQLDQEDGQSDGIPLLENESQYRQWISVFDSEFDRLEALHRCVLDRYAFEDDAEFLAVATEAFFEKSIELEQQAPKLYQILTEFYKVDPAAWIKNDN
ncbi:MAG: zinc-dependent peptidase [Planctomycetaceae bacterium]|nr:zinc-dependent peptidase [Planctomycetaceae bacterium]